jgi:hypothetical protein
MARLSTELGDIRHKVTPLLWSGANSIFVRDKTAQVLAEHLSAEHAEHPQATQLIIAHSHGGNIALRALHLLRQRHASRLYGAESSNPLVATLATPFIEVHRADFSSRTFFIRQAVLLSIISLYGLALLLAVPLFLDLPFAIPLTILIGGGFVIAGLGWWWIVRRASARQNRLNALKDATRLGEVVSSQRCLVVRAVDDEASLALALGAILNYAIARFIKFIFYLIMPLVVMMITFVYWFSLGPSFGKLVVFIFTAFIIAVLLALMVARSVHGRELALSPIDCQINTQSTPDAVDLSKIVTLVSQTQVTSLRHGIYDHEVCAKAISDWVRSQHRLGAQG